MARLIAYQMLLSPLPCLDALGGCVGRGCLFVVLCDLSPGSNAGTFIYHRTGTNRGVSSPGFESSLLVTPRDLEDPLNYSESLDPPLENTGTGVMHTCPGHEGRPQGPTHIKRLRLLLSPRNGLVCVKKLGIHTY